MSSIDPSNTQSIASLNLNGLDLETALMSVQTQRANLLEAQLKDQISAVQAKNEQISKLNQALGALNALAAAFPSDAKAGDTIGGTPSARANDYALEKQANSAMAEAGIQPNPGSLGRMNNGDPKSNHGPDTGWTSGTWYQGGVCGKSTKGEVDGTVQKVKSLIDSLSNTQQMDMLRLQSLTNKRNEAFETMTNFIKKMQDSRNSIVGNMR
jgi:hypothetical protein